MSSIIVLFDKRKKFIYGLFIHRYEDTLPIGLEARAMRLRTTLFIHNPDLLDKSPGKITISKKTKSCGPLCGGTMDKLAITTFGTEFSFSEKRIPQTEIPGP
jgi:hypothetical protein